MSKLSKLTVTIRVVTDGLHAMVEAFGRTVRYMSVFGIHAYESAAKYRDLAEKATDHVKLDDE